MLQTSALSQNKVIRLTREVFNTRTNIKIAISLHLELLAVSIKDLRLP